MQSTTSLQSHRCDSYRIMSSRYIFSFCMSAFPDVIRLMTVQTATCGSAGSTARIVPNMESFYGELLGRPTVLHKFITEDGSVEA